MTTARPQLWLHSPLGPEPSFFNLLNSTDDAWASPLARALLCDLAPERVTVRIDLGGPGHGVWLGIQPASERGASATAAALDDLVQLSDWSVSRSPRPPPLPGAAVGLQCAASRARVPLDRVLPSMWLAELQDRSDARGPCAVTLIIERGGVNPALLAEAVYTLDAATEERRWQELRLKNRRLTAEAVHDAGAVLAEVVDLRASLYLHLDPVPSPGALELLASEFDRPGEPPARFGRGPATARPIAVATFESLLRMLSGGDADALEWLEGEGRRS